MNENEAKEAIANHIFTDEINRIGVSFSIETCLALASEILSIHTEEWRIVVCSMEHNYKHKGGKY